MNLADELREYADEIHPTIDYDMYLWLQDFADKLEGKSDATDTILKPCPFCGSNDIYTRIGIYMGKIHESVTIICCDCEANIWGATEEKAITAWNRRAKQ